MKTPEEKQLIVMEECLNMLKLTKKYPVLYAKAKEVVMEKLNNNELFQTIIKRAAEQN